MSELDEKPIEDPYERRKILRELIDFYNQQISKGIPSVHFRAGLAETTNQLREVEEEIDDRERQQLYDVSKTTLPPFELGEIFYHEAQKLLLEIKQLEDGEDLNPSRVDKLRTEAMYCLISAIRNGYIKAETFFLLAQIHDLQGNTYEAFEYYTTSIILNENYKAAREARLLIFQIILGPKKEELKNREEISKAKDESYKFIRRLFEKDSNILRPRKTTDIHNEIDDKSETQVNTMTLRHILTNHFNDSELRNICSDLDVDYENLPAQEKEGKARELMAYLERRGRTAELVTLCRRLRPNADWQSVAQITPL